ncbi:unnamed protein product [Phaedon cochleariae]|uniref:Sulfhydryl oxidase n=1 Tax=Phaedon cochleariae TaxID=80249 RepID=A0A9P0GQI2_PHACE|nr:unnamed protein product [Phaedon cochleariae]
MLPTIVQSTLILLSISSVIQISENSALSIFEQKKYKRYTDAQGLYSSKDDVDILTVENFKNELYGNKRAWLIEFYNSWCGFCQRFAPSWKALATDVKDWKSLVGIGVIDCSNDQNNAICREFEIMSYPTIKYFHENYQEDLKQLGHKISVGSDVREHRQKLLREIMNEQAEDRGKQYPNILPYTHEDLSLIFNGVDSDVRYTFLIVQEPTDFIGQELAMDFHKIRDISISYSFNNNTDLVKMLKLSKFPAIFSVAQDLTFQSLNPSASSREAYKISISQFLKPKHITVPVNVKKEIFEGKWLENKAMDMKEFMHEREREALKEKIKKMGDVVFQMDLETALRYSLKHEVAGVKEITGDKLEALKTYLNVLAKYFPFGKYGQQFLRQLRDFVASRTTLDGNEIAKLLESAEKEESQVFSTPQNWLACKGSSTAFRGYPCGLWKMFHYLSVNAADSSMGLKGASPMVVLGAMHGYIKNFFGCADCSRHFQEMAKRQGIFEVTSWDDSILWLWMAHNEVNKRLSGDETEDPEFPKQQFPTQEKCPRCHNKDDSWNIPEVLHYLKHVYSSINIRYIGSDTRILHLGLDGSTVRSEPSFFKSIDAAMCFILYVASFLLIIALIHMFLRRGYRKKLYAHDLLGKV